MALGALRGARSIEPAAAQMICCALASAATHPCDSVCGDWRLPPAEHMDSMFLAVWVAPAAPMMASTLSLMNNRWSVAVQLPPAKSHEATLQAGAQPRPASVAGGQPGAQSASHVACPLARACVLAGHRRQEVLFGRGWCEPGGQGDRAPSLHLWPGGHGTSATDATVYDPGSAAWQVAAPARDQVAAEEEHASQLSGVAPPRCG